MQKTGKKCGTPDSPDHCTLLAERDKEICCLKSEIEKLKKCQTPGETSCCPSETTCSLDDPLQKELDKRLCEIKKLKNDLARLKREKDCVPACQSRGDANKKICKEVECRAKEIENIKCELDKIRAEACCPKPQEPCSPKPPEPCCPKPADPCCPKPVDPCCPKPADPCCPKPADPCCPKPKEPYWPNSRDHSCPPRSASPLKNEKCDKQTECLCKELSDKAREIEQLKNELCDIKKEKEMFMNMLTAKSNSPSCKDPCPTPKGDPCCKKSTSQEILCKLNEGQEEIRQLRCELEKLKKSSGMEDDEEDKSCEDGEETDKKEKSRPGTRNASPTGKRRGSATSPAKSPVKKPKGK